MDTSRDSECNEPQVVQGFIEDRHGHSRNHFEEGCEREPNKPKDGTFHDDVYDAPPHTNKHTSVEHGWRPHKPGSGAKVRGTEAW